MLDSKEEEHKEGLQLPRFTVMASIHSDDGMDITPPPKHNPDHLTQIEIQKHMGKPANTETVNVVNKYSKKPCKKFWYNFTGWFAYIWFWFAALFGCLIFGPLFFASLKIRYIWNDMVWESLVAQILKPEDCTYALTKFPYPCKLF